MNKFKITVKEIKISEFHVRSDTGHEALKILVEQWYEKGFDLGITDIISEDTISVLFSEEGEVKNED